MGPTPPPLLFSGARADDGRGLRMDDPRRDARSHHTANVTHLGHGQKSQFDASPWDTCSQEALQSCVDDLQSGFAVRSITTGMCVSYESLWGALYVAIFPLSARSATKASASAAGKFAAPPPCAWILTLHLFPSQCMQAFSGNKAIWKLSTVKTSRCCIEVGQVEQAGRSKTAVPVNELKYWSLLLNYAR